MNDFQQTFKLIEEVRKRCQEIGGESFGLHACLYAALIRGNCVILKKISSSEEDFIQFEAIVCPKTVQIAK